MRLALLGGTFDPPHIGHLIVASDVWDALSLDRVIFVPAAVPPHKRGGVVASPEQRLEMVRAAIADDPRFEVDDIELRRDGPSYSVDTLREMRARYPDAELYFIVGADQLREFASWREPDEIVRLARLIAIARDGDEVPALPYDVVRVPVTRIDLSSTDIRRRIAEGRPVRYVLPEAVGSVVERMGLYTGGGV